MTLFQRVLNHLNKTSTIFSADEEKRQIYIHRVYNSVILTFYKGGNLRKLEVRTSDHLFVEQTYGERERWALYEREEGKLVLFGTTGKIDIYFSITQL